MEQEINQFGGEEFPETQIDLSEIPDEVPIEPEHDQDQVPVEPEAEEVEQEQEVSNEPQKPKRDTLKTRLNQVQREKYQALSELNRLREELDHVRAQADLSSQAATAHYDANVETRLAMARQRLIAAKETGDVNAEIDAEIELGRAVSELENIKNWKAQETLRNQSPQRISHEKQDVSFTHNQPIIEDWVQDNADWIMPQSQSYDRDLVENVDEYTRIWNNNLAQNGLGHMIGSPEYMQHLNLHVQKARQAMRKQTAPQTNSRQLNMQQGRQSVAPARSFAGGNSRPTYQLTSDEKQMIRDLGITPEKYVASQLLDRKVNKHKRGGM